MRIILVSLGLTCLAVTFHRPHFSPHYDAGTHYDSRAHYDAPISGGDLFVAPLDSNGIFSKNDFPSSVPSPDFAWYAWDPTNIDGSTETLTENSAPANADTPFCPGGDFSDLTDSGDPNSVKCAVAKSFDGSDDNYSGADIMNADNDLSVCALVRLSQAFPSVAVVSRRNTSDADGWVLGFGSSGQIQIYTEAGATTSAVSVGGNIQDEWVVACATIDIDGNAIPYSNATAGTPGAAASGDKSATDGLRIGDGGSYADFNGEIVFVLMWDGTILSGQQISDLTWHIFGITDTTGYGVNSYTNGGVSIAWYDGLLEEFRDDTPKIGAEIPPGYTGAGTEGGFVSLAALTNSIPYTEDLSSWTEVGTTVTCSESTTPFRDARTICSIEDDDAAGLEYIYTAASIAALSNGDNITICIAARSDTGTKGLDILWQESGTCVASNYTATSQDITTSWAVLEFNHTVQDDTCDNILPQIGAVSQGGDLQTTTETGFAYMVVLGLYLGSDGVCPMYYSGPTTGSAAAYGDDALLYDISTDVVDGSGNIPGFRQIKSNVVIGQADLKSALRYWDLTDSGRTAYLALAGAADDTHTFDDATWSITSAALSWTAGTSYTFNVTVDYVGNSAELLRDTTSLGTDTDAATSPTGLDRFAVGGAYDGSTQSNEGVWMSNVKITR